MLYKYNCREYEQMKLQRSEKRAKRTEEERRSEKRKAEEKDRGAQRNNVFLMFWDPRGSKSRLAEAAKCEVNSFLECCSFGVLLEVELLKKCTLWWRGSTCGSQNVKSTPGLERLLLEVELFKKCARCVGAKRAAKSKLPHVRTTLGCSSVVLSGRRNGRRTLCQKWAKRVAFAAVSKTMACVGRLQKTCKDAFRVGGAVQETCPSDMLGGQGADFLRKVGFWIFAFPKMILPDRCNTSDDLASHFHGSRVLDRCIGKKNRKENIGTRLSALR